MNIVTIQKPAPHCPIPYGHPLHKGYVPADETKIWETWARCSRGYADDYDMTERTAHLDMIGEFAK